MWTIVIGDLPARRRGQVEWATETIMLAPDLTPEQRRCTLAHEMFHVMRGPVPPSLVPREERTINREAARHLIPLAALVDALRWSEQPSEVAELLGVTVPMIWARINGLSRFERAQVTMEVDR